MEPRSFIAPRVCLLLAICGAGYLAAVSLSGGAVAGCGPESGCNHVLGSRWAYWMGIPVSLPALGVYLTLFIATLGAGKTEPAAHHWRAWQVIAILSPLIVLAALWFVALQFFVIKSWCKFCLGTHASAALGAILLLRQMPGRSTGQNSGRSPAFAGPNLLTAGVGAMVGLAILIGGQVAVNKQLFNITPTADKAPARIVRQISLHDGQINLDPDELPLIGSRSATNFIVSLFDYTCIHCRRLHPLLTAVEEKYPGRFGIISLPMPLDSTCNPMVRATNPASRNACDYAKLSLAVWHAQPKAFREFDEWLFTSNRPPPIEEARAKAEIILGKEALDHALSDPWVARQLKTDIDLYIANAAPPGDGRLPQLIFSDIIARGAIERQEEVQQLLDHHIPFSGNVQPKTNAPAH